MKKVLLIALGALSLILVSSCMKVTAPGCIEWSTGGRIPTYWSQIVSVNKIYRSVFAQYGELYGEEESTGNEIIIDKATAKKQVSEPFENGIEEANNRIKSELSFTITTDKPGSDTDYLTLVVKAGWSDWSDSRTYYLVF